MAKEVTESTLKKHNLEIIICKDLSVGGGPSSPPPFKRASSQIVIISISQVRLDIAVPIKKHLPAALQDL
jgi:hypothetical protein